MQTRRTIFDLLVCLSLVNLLLLRIWAQLLPAVVNPANLYYLKQAPHWIHYPAVLSTLFVSSGILCALAAWARRSARRWSVPLARGALLILVLLALNAIRDQLPPEVQGALVRNVGVAGAGAIGFACLAAFVALLRFRPSAVFAVVEVFAIVASPFLLMTVGQALWAWATYDPQSFAGGSFAGGDPAVVLPRRGERAPRVMWIVFDELDQRAAFVARPESLDLPEFDRMRKQSFFAANAFSPARETRPSMASVLLGRQVSWSMPTGPTTLPCAIDGAGPADAVSDCWRDYPNLFAEVRDAEVNVGIAGWYHPYCRIFREWVTACTWAGLPYWDSSNLAYSFDQQWEEIVKAIPVLRLRLRPGARIRASHRDAYEVIHRAALEIAADPGIGFALLHYPVPHHPDIYDPDRRELSIRDESSYFDNLALADRALGEVRAAMEAADLWDTSTVIATSDHWWRAIHRGDWGLLPQEEAVYAEGRDRRIPLLVKFRGQRDSRSYAKPFSTLLLHDLVLEIFAGRLESAEALCRWLDANRARAPIPYLPRRRPPGGPGRPPDR